MSGRLSRPVLWILCTGISQGSPQRRAVRNLHPVQLQRTFGRLWRRNRFVPIPPFSNKVMIIWIMNWGCWQFAKYSMQSCIVVCYYYQILEFGASKLKSSFSNLMNTSYRFNFYPGSQSFLLGFLFIRVFWYNYLFLKSRSCFFNVFCLHYSTSKYSNMYRMCLVQSTEAENVLKRRLNNFCDRTLHMWSQHDWSQLRRMHGRLLWISAGRDSRGLQTLSLPGWWEVRTTVEWWCGMHRLCGRIHWSVIYNIHILIILFSDI